MANLEFLSLAANYLIGDIPGSLIDLDNLTYLDLCNNDLQTDDTALCDFLNSVQDGGNWESCQNQLGPAINNLAFKPCISELATTNIDVTATEPYVESTFVFLGSLGWRRYFRYR